MSWHFIQMPHVQWTPYNLDQWNESEIFDMTSYITKESQSITNTTSGGSAWLVAALVVFMKRAMEPWGQPCMTTIPTSQSDKAVGTRWYRTDLLVIILGQLWQQLTTPVHCFNMKITFLRIGISIAINPSHLCYGTSLSGKTTSLYLNRFLVADVSK